MRGNNFDFIHLESKRGFPRLGVIIPLHSHNVVERNRLKRRVKEVMRRFVLTELELGRDIVIRARKRAYDIDYETVKNELIELSRNMKEGENPR